MLHNQPYINMLNVYGLFILLVYTCLILWPSDCLGTVDRVQRLSATMREMRVETKAHRLLESRQRLTKLRRDLHMALQDLKVTMNSNPYKVYSMNMSNANVRSEAEFVVWLTGTRCCTSCLGNAYKRWQVVCGERDGRNYTTIFAHE